MSNTVNNDEFSDREEIDGDPQLPNLEQIYQTNNDQCFFSQSYILTRQLVQNILKKTYITIEERSFEVQVPINSCAQVLSIMELIVISAFNQDGLQSDISNTIEDQEPIIINYDRWRRNRVNIKEGSITCSEEEDQLEELPSQPNSSKQNKQRFSVLEKKKTNNIIQPPKSSSSEVRLIEFQVVEEEDDFVDKLRQKKLYDLKKKNEIEQKIKEDLVQNQKKDSSTNKYTYDYDGKILLNKGVKMDKLQPTTLKIKVDLKDVPKTQNTQSLQSLINTKKGSKQIIQTNNQQQQQSIPLPPKATAEIPNKNIVDRKDITKDVTGDKGLRLDRGAQFPYEIFTMTNGVKLIYEQRYKEGLKHQVSDSAEQLQYRLSGQNFLPGDDVAKQMQQIRLTRTEYKMLTDNGNPFQQQQQTKSQFISVDVQETVNKTTATTEIKKQVQFNENHQVKSKYTSPEKKQEKISMKNAKLLESMLVAQQKPETPSKPVKNGSEPITKNPVDLFNQSLLNSKDWGKPNNKISQFPPVKVSQSRGHNGSLEQLYRLPRDRINIQQQRTQSEFYKLQPRRASHKSMIFVAKFLNLYIEGFGGSQVQIYQGAVNLQKVQLKLQTLNKLLKESLIPFTILKADIEILNIDIPWSSLTTQSIKTYISGLNVIIQYNEQEDIETLIQDLGKKQNNENKISIQDEIRKHKEIDEQVLKKFVKKLLLNLSFDIRDIQVELLIKQQYRLQMVLQQFNTSCQDNLRINIEDADQFHRELKIDTFFIKLIRFNDDDISNQQLLALDQCNAYIERAKDSIHCNLEFNNLNLILDKDITIMAHDALEKQILKEQHIINKLNEFKIQPIHENFIFRDITTVSKGIQLSLFINSLFLQSSQLTLFLEQCQIQARQFLQQTFYKLSFNSINMKYNSQKLLTLQKLESNEFSIWPELHHPDEQIVIEITLNQSERMKLIEQKVTLQIESILIDFDLQNILNNYQAIQKHIQSYQGFVQVKPKPNTQTKSMQKKLIYKMNLMKNKIIMSAFGNNQLKLLFQSNTQINLYQKKDKIKTIELKHQQLQFQLYDQYQHLLFSITGLNIILDYFKTINLNFHFMQVQLRLHKLTLLQINQLQKLFLKQEKSITSNNNNQQIEKQIKPIQICVQIDRCSIDFGQCMENHYISLLTLNIKQLELKLQILDNNIDEIDLQSNLNIWTTHPLQKFSSKITNTMLLKLIWNRVVKPDKIQNILQILNGIEINLSQLTISNLLNLGNLLSGLDVINIIHNKTKKTILINILCNQQTISYQLKPDSQTFLTQLYDNIQDSKDYPTLQIQVGLEINESLQLWSQLHPFHFSKQYFNKFIVFDEIDQQEHDIFLKAVNNEFVLTQQEKQIPDINIAEPIFENLSEYDITFKPANAEQIQIDGNSKQVFHTKLNEQNSISLTLNTENQQEIKFNLKEVSQYKAVLSFNFVKIDNNFYNVLLSIELIKDPKGQYIQKIIIKPFLIIINLLPWNFSIGNAQFINLPISVDVNMNNALITHFDHQLDQFYVNLLDNRKYTSNSQQIIINGQVTNLQYINFLKEGKYAIEINKRHHMIMIFRNNVLVQNQMCFVICRNIYQQQIKYLLIRNQTQFYFIIMKNKSRINIFPFTDNCLEYNIQKGDKYRLFITNHEFEVMQLLDSETLTKNNLKVNKIQIQNIHLIEIMVDVQKIVGKEFKISIPNIKIDIQICKKQEINIYFDLNMRFFSNTHLDILIQSFILQSEGVNVINIVDCFSIIEVSNSTDLNLVVVNNIFFKMKEIKLNINQQFLNIIKLLISLLRLDPLFIRREIQQTNKCSWDSLIQTTFLILNLIVDPITLEINIQTVINMNNSINLPQLQIKMKKFNPNQLKSEIISFYLAFLITKIPTIQLLFQNIPNPLSLFSAKKQDIDIVKLPYFFIHHPISTRSSIIQYVILQKKCKILNQKCEIILQSDKLIILSSTTQNIDLNQIIKMKQNKNSLTLYLEQNNKIKIMSNQSNLIGNLIKSLLY